MASCAQENTSGWDTEEVVQSASYDIDVDRKLLTNVTNIGTIQVGSLVEETGVGREIYVHDIDVAANTITLSNPLYGAAASQAYTFKRFKYLLDFSGFTQLSRLVISKVDFSGIGLASGLMLPKSGITNTVSECFFHSAS